MSIVKYLNPTIAMFAYLIKCLVISVSYADAIIMLVISAIYGFKLYINQNKHSEVDQIKQEIVDVKNAISSIKLERSMGNSNVKAPQTKKLF